jgi:hypothetical protein
MKIKLDPAAPRLGKADWNKLAERTEGELHQAALDDPDNPPLTDDELARFAPPPDVRKIREQLELTQSEFALISRSSADHTGEDSSPLPARRVVRRDSTPGSGASMT